MTPEREQRARQVAGQISSLEPERHDEVLSELCRDDDQLRADVLALLSAGNRPGSGVFPGRMLGRYQTEEELGRGGMGVVFSARDTQLTRRVAIKVLAHEKAISAERKRRFMQEAKAASALNHPNIVTIHDISSDDGIDFIVMEYVEGRPLDQWIGKEGLSLGKALRIAVQIADALAKAHSVGIVHRDLKPANVMVGDDLTVKVLDFGLAKLTEKSDSGEYDATRTMLQPGGPVTDAGTILGSCSYMSPEQAEGLATDGRSDIFSFGCLFYETLTGRRAFEGKTPMATISAILRDEPIPVEEVKPDLPAPLARLVQRCLRKNLQRRYQHMGDVRVDLQELEEEREAGRLNAPPVAAAAPPGPPQWKRWLPVVAGIAAVAALAGWSLLGRAGSNRSASLLPGLSLSVLTHSQGLAEGPAWSPDGSWIAYASNRNGGMHIWKRSVQQGEEIQLTDSPAGRDRNPAWSPRTDEGAGARTIAYASADPGAGGIYLVSERGGQPTRLTGFGDHPVWSPDGTRLAFEWQGSLWLLEQIMPYPQAEPRRLLSGMSNTTPVAWTRSNHLLYWDRTLRDVFAVAIGSGETRALNLVPAGHEVVGLSVSADSRLLAMSRGPFGGNKDLWTVELDPGSSMPAGSPARLTVSAGDEVACAVAPEATRIACAHETVSSNLWLLPLDQRTGLLANSPPRQLTHDGERNYYPYASPDGGTVVWTQQRGGQGLLYTLNLTTGEVRKVTDLWQPNYREVGASISPSGAIAFASTLRGAYHLWRVESPGGLAFPLAPPPSRPGTQTGRIADSQTAWSPDGARIAFYSNRSGNWDIWMLDTTAPSPEPRQLMDWPSNELYPAWRPPDGRILAFASDKEGNQDIWAMDREGALIGPLANDPAAVESQPVFSLDGRRLYFTSNRSGEFNVWMVPVDPAGKPEGDPVPITRYQPSDNLALPDSPLFSKFTVAQPGLVLQLRSRSSDLLLVENFRSKE